MDNEVAVPEPLSGTEVIEAIVFKVREQLRRDCYLSPNSAYEYFKAKIRIEIAAIDCGNERGVKADIDVELREQPEIADLQTETSDEIVDRMPPNVVRRETEQPVPVVTQDAVGKQEQRRVKYARTEKELPRGGSKANHKTLGGKGPSLDPAA